MPVEVVVGVVTKPHGVRGSVVVALRTDSPEHRFAVAATLVVAGGPDPLPARTLTVVACHGQGDHLVVTFAEVTDRADAQALAGATLLAELDPREGPDEPDTYYDHQLVGLVVRTRAGDRLGTVSGVAHGSAQDLLVVQAADGHQTLVPFVAAIVPDVDLPAGQLTVDPPAGLFDVGGL